MRSSRSWHLPRTVGIGALVLALGALGACSSDSGSTPSSSTASSAAAEPVTVGGSVVSTAGSSNETDIVLPAPITAGLTELGNGGSGVEWVAVAGDGTTSTEPIGLTGDAGAAIADLTEKM